MDLINKQGYRLPFGVPAKGYPWGSNSFVLTNAMILGLAYDFSKDSKYLNGVAMGMVVGSDLEDLGFLLGGDLVDLGDRLVRRVLDGFETLALIVLGDRR